LVESINALYHLNAKILAALRQAKRVGLALQPTREAAIFVGFDDLPFQEGAAKLPGLLGVCRK